MRHDVTQEEADSFRKAVERLIEEIKEDPRKGEELLIRAGTHRRDEETGKLVLVEGLRTDEALYLKVNGVLSE